jgi:hypothetical protein
LAEAKKNEGLESIKKFVLDAIKNKEYNKDTLIQLKDMIAGTEGSPQLPN